jgi:hypothetical protein
VNEHIRVEQSFSLAHKGPLAGDKEVFRLCEVFLVKQSAGEKFHRRENHGIALHDTSINFHDTILPHWLGVLQQSILRHAVVLPVVCSAIFPLQNPFAV